MDMLVIAAAHDRPLAVLRHDEGQRGGADLARMDRDAVLRAHVLEHPPQPVIGDGGDQVRHDPQFGAAEGRGDGIAAERHRVGLGDMLLVAGRHVVGNEGDVDIGLSNEEGLHVSHHSLKEPGRAQRAGVSALRALHRHPVEIASSYRASSCAISDRSRSIEPQRISMCSSQPSNLEAAAVVSRRATSWQPPASTPLSLSSRNLRTCRTRHKAE